MSRHARKVDANQDEIVRALRVVGCRVQSLAKVGDGCPDLLVGWRRQVFLLEVKDGSKPPSERKLTPAQEGWHRLWRGLPVFVVESVEQAFRAIGVTTEAA